MGRGSCGRDGYNFCARAGGGKGESVECTDGRGDGGDLQAVVERRYCGNEWSCKGGGGDGAGNGDVLQLNHVVCTRRVCG